MATISRARLEADLAGHLAFLYGDAGKALLPRLLSSLSKTAPEPAESRHSDGLNERDAVLITYADQVRQPGVATFRTLAEFCERHLTETVSAVHILPFYPATSDDGFSVADYYRVDPAYGDWDDVARLGRRFNLMFDAVFNHMSAQSEWFQEFLADDPEYGDFFVTVKDWPDLSMVVRPRALPLLTEFSSASGLRHVWTTFSADQVDLNFKNPEVLLRFVEILLFYVMHGARYIRLDAIAYLWKEIGTKCIHLPQTHRVVQLMRTVLDLAAPEVVLITETNVPHTDNISYFGDGANEAQLVYNFALPPLVLHSIATGNAAKLSAWASTLNCPSGKTGFFNFLASHDGIGVNPARGILSQEEINALVQRAQHHGGYVSYKNNPDGSRSPYEMNVNYFDALSNPAAVEPANLPVARFLCAQAIQFALAGVPGIYFHSLFGSRNDRTGAEASGIPRRINRQKLDLAKLEGELRVPDSLRTRVFAGMRQLLAVRRKQPAFHPQAPQEILSLDERVFALRRTSRDGHQRVVCLHNVSHVTVDCSWVETGSARDCFTDALVVPGQGRAAITLAPYQVMWLVTQ